MSRWIVALSVLAIATTAQAQIRNPTVIEWEQPQDFPALDGFVAGYFSSATAIAPVQEANVAKPATCSPCSASPLPSRPAAFQTWWLALRGVAGGVSSDWSNRVPFVRAPEPPVNVRVR